MVFHSAGHILGDVGRLVRVHGRWDNDSRTHEYSVDHNTNGISALVSSGIRTFFCYYIVKRLPVIPTRLSEIPERAMGMSGRLPGFRLKLYLQYCGQVLEPRYSGQRIHFHIQRPHSVSRFFASLRNECVQTSR